jgi:putative ABC transport system ATP-binding protein
LKWGGERLEADDQGINATKYSDQIAIVMQSPAFFNGTIADNIRLGMPLANDKEVATAAKRAQCTFIKDLPDGMNTGK